MVGNKKESDQTHIHSGHRERLRTILLENGYSEEIPEHSLLEYLLFYTIPRKDTNEIAHRLLDAFGGSIVNVLDATYNELMKVDGITRSTAALISFILPLASRYVKEAANDKKFLKDKEAARCYLSSKFFLEKVEVVYLLCLDGRGRILACPKLSTGDELSVGVKPRTIVEKVVKTGATAVMLAHNHPKGYPVPSNADIEVTINVATALSNLDVAFLDHIIIGNGETLSLANSKNYSYLF